MFDSVSELWTDLPIFLACTLFLLGLVGIGEWLNARLHVSAEVTRRLIHAFTGLFVTLSPLLFASPFWIYVLALIFMVANFVAIQHHWFQGMHGISRKSWGTVTFPLALLFALVTSWSPDEGRIFAIQCTFLVLSFSDPLASWVGMSVPKPIVYQVGGSKKSVAGSVAFAVSAFLLVLLGLYLNGFDLRWGWDTIVLAAFTSAVAATLAEALGGDGWDNFFMVVAILTALVFVNHHHGLAYYLAFSVLVGIGFAFLAWRLTFLDLSGVFAVALLGMTVFGLGEWKWSLPGLTFFVLSSILSKLGKKRKAALEGKNEKTSRRDAGQVYANGGFAWAMLVLYVFFQHEAFYWAFVASFAAAAADTWGTEIGGYFQGKTWQLPAFRPVPPGVSGGISVSGTIGAFLGSGVVWLAGAAFLGDVWVWKGAFVIVGAGMVSMFLDSILGGTVQAQYMDASGVVVERRYSGLVENRLIAGYRWVNNDRVNLANTFLGGILGGLCYLGLS